MIPIEHLLLTFLAITITLVFIGLFHGIERSLPAPEFGEDAGGDYPTPIYPTLHAWVVGPRAIHARHARAGEWRRRGCPVCYELGLHLLAEKLKKGSKGTSTGGGSR
jgi:hypothetical protein